jgi:signal recognition particle receptor subunit beta
MFINWKLREINLKIVYYGPALSGKTTNLEYIHSKLKPELRGELISLKTREDRTIFFDFLQLEVGEIKRLKPKFNLYTVPGQVIYAASRKLVLQGADGVVFVADSQWNRLQDNVESMRNLEENLRQLGHDLTHLPLTIQYNKRDLPDRTPITILEARLGCNGVPHIESVAIHGIGVFDTLKTIINAVVTKVQREIG